MKNDSHLFPVETPMDSLFDSNKDGKLTGFETAMRDAALYDSEKCFHESKAEKEKQKKYTKIAIIVISICIAIGLIAFLGFDLSYRAAINEAIESEHAWSFHFDVDKHPNYKDAQGWELYGKQLDIQFSPDDVKYILDEMKEYYSDEILNRVKFIIKNN